MSPVPNSTDHRPQASPQASPLFDQKQKKIPYISKRRFYYFIKAIASLIRSLQSTQFRVLADDRGRLPDASNRVNWPRCRFRENWKKPWPFKCMMCHVITNQGLFAIRWAFFLSFKKNYYFVALSFLNHQTVDFDILKHVTMQCNKFSPFVI